MKPLFGLLLFATLLLGSCNSPLPDKLQTGEESTTTNSIQEDNVYYGKAVNIADGDTYRLLTSEKQEIKIRMSYIDAPEKNQPFGQKSKHHLGELLEGHTIRFVELEKDQYGRSLGLSYLEDGTEVGHAMVQDGYAWHYKKLSKAPELQDLEDEARRNHRGLWCEKNPMQPWAFRYWVRQGLEPDEVINRFNRGELK